MRMRHFHRTKIIQFTKPIIDSETLSAYASAVNCRRYKNYGVLNVEFGKWSRNILFKLHGIVNLHAVCLQFGWYAIHFSLLIIQISKSFYCADIVDLLNPSYFNISFNGLHSTIRRCLWICSYIFFDRSKNIKKEKFWKMLAWLVIVCSWFLFLAIFSCDLFFFLLLSLFFVTIGLWHKVQLDRWFSKYADWSVQPKKTTARKMSQTTIEIGWH